MDKRDKIRTKLLEAQEELDKIDDDYLKLKNELDTKLKCTLSSRQENN